MVSFQSAGMLCCWLCTTDHGNILLDTLWF